MPTLKPFRALRPSARSVQQIASLPYDVFSESEARRLALKSPQSFIHVTRPEVDLPVGTDPHSDAVYSKGLENFNLWIEKRPLIMDNDAALYLYELTLGEQVQTGVVGCFSVDDYEEGIIKKHEKTRQDKEDDRTRHIVTLEAQTGPVFLTYRHAAAIDAEVTHLKLKSQPLFDFTAEDGVKHRVWKVSHPIDLDQLKFLFESEIQFLYIADGHHRAAAAARARKQLGERFEHSNSFMAVAFPDHQLKILPYYRMVKDLNGHSNAEFLKLLEVHFELATGAGESPAKGEFGVYLEGEWRLLRPHKPQGAVLDCDLLQTQVLGPLLGIQDPRNSKRIEFVGGIRGPQALRESVDRGDARIAFTLCATTVAEVMAVCDRGEIMPPKSTWFEPKLRDGLLIHSFS